MKKTTIPHSIIPLLLCGVLLYSLFIPKTTNAVNVNLADQKWTIIDEGLLIQPGTGILNQGNSTQDPTKTFTNLFNFMMGFVGIAAFFMITWGGIQYSASAGNPSMLQAAKDKIWGAIFGLILAGFSVVILQTINPDLVKFRLSTSGQNTTTDCLYPQGCTPTGGPLPTNQSNNTPQSTNAGANSGSIQSNTPGGTANQQNQLP